MDLDFNCYFKIRGSFPFSCHVNIGTIVPNFKKPPRFINAAIIALVIVTADVSDTFANDGLHLYSNTSLGR